jgi:hypothetical protein
MVIAAQQEQAQQEQCVGIKALQGSVLNIWAAGVEHRVLLIPGEVATAQLQEQARQK